MKPYVTTLPKFAHIAHRGGSLLAPENTMAAFTMALERYRTDILELDVQPSKDGHVMVIHDDTLERTTNGQGLVREQTLSELQSLDAGFHMPAFRGKGVCIPTLDEVLSALPHVHVNIELKASDDAFFDALAAVVREHGAVERVCIGHVDEERALALHARLPECAFWYSESAVLRFFMASRGDAPLPNDTVFDILELPLEYGGVPVVDGKLVRDAHSVGKLVQVWTVDDADTMRRLIDLGVDGIISDRPDVLREVMGERGLG